MISVSKECFLEMLDEPTTEEVRQDKWRHGYRQIVKVEHEGRPYLAAFSVHSEEGIQIYGEVRLRPAKQETRVVWVEAKDPDPEEPTP